MIPINMRKSEKKKEGDRRAELHKRYGQQSRLEAEKQNTKSLGGASVDLKTGKILLPDTRTKPNSQTLGREVLPPKGKG